MRMWKVITLMCPRPLPVRPLRQCRGRESSTVAANQKKTLLTGDSAKKQRIHGSTDCLLSRLPEAILHDTLSRLSICDLLRARQTCVS
jgi:hypothetical protein